MSEAGISVRFNPSNPPADTRYEVSVRWYSPEQLFAASYEEYAMDGFEREDFIASVTA